MPVSTAASRKPTCLQCGGRMRAATRGSGAGLAAGLLMLAGGVLATFYLPVIGCAAGPLLCVAAIFAGVKRRKVWLCDGCGGFFDRVGSA
jgi:hypothetical protein